MAGKMMRAVGALAMLAAFALPTIARSQTPPTGSGAKPDVGTITVGSADFSENQLLATIYGKALSAKGVATTLRLNIGSREVYLPALLDGSIDLIIEYSGATLSYLDKQATAHSPRDVEAALRTALPSGVSLLTPSSAQNSDVLVVTQSTATKYNLKTIADLEPVAGELVLGGPPEWKTRHEGVAGLKEVYGLKFKSFRALDAGGPLSLAAVLNGQVQVADLFSTDPAITVKKLVPLEDTKNLFPAQNIAPIMASPKASELVVKTLNAVSAALTTEDLIEMNGRLAKQESIDRVADDWLAAKKLK